MAALETTTVPLPCYGMSAMGELSFLEPVSAVYVELQGPQGDSEPKERIEVSSVATTAERVSLWRFHTLGLPTSSPETFCTC